MGACQVHATFMQYMPNACQQINNRATTMAVVHLLNMHAWHYCKVRACSYAQELPQPQNCIASASLMPQPYVASQIDATVMPGICMHVRNA